MARVIYFVKSIPPLFHVIHSNNNRIVSSFTTQLAADADASARNSVNPPITRDWDIATASEILGIKILLNQGFEPFAVENGKVYLKKKAK